MPSGGGLYWNYWVPIFNLALSSIDLVMVQAYNNWYDSLSPGSLDYLKDVYLNWRNIQSPYCTGCTPIANFTGVPASKLSIGVPASSSAAGPNFSYSVDTLSAFQSWLASQNYTLIGYMIWSSHWDSLNNYAISNVLITGAAPSPVPPPQPTPSNLCTS